MFEYKNINCISHLESMQSKSVDLAIVDPPYFRILKNDWDQFKTEEDYLNWSKEYLTLIVEKLRYSGTLVLYGCTRNFNILCSLNNILRELGMYFVQEIILDKGMKSVAGRTSPKIKMLPPVTENILVYRKDAKPYVKSLLLQKQKEVGISAIEIKRQMGFPINGGGNWTKYAGDTEFPLLPTEEHWLKLMDILHIDLPYSQIREVFNSIMGITNVWNDLKFTDRNRFHPSQKPIQLAERCVSLFSNEGDLVYIPFVGSGNDIIACEKLMRNSIGSELSLEYFTKSIVHIQENLSMLNK